jgi:hypothetical protein
LPARFQLLCLGQGTGAGSLVSPASGLLPPPTPPTASLLNPYFNFLFSIFMHSSIDRRLFPASVFNALAWLSRVVILCYFGLRCVTIGSLSCYAGGAHVRRMMIYFYIIKIFSQPHFSCKALRVSTSVFFLLDKPRNIFPFLLLGPDMTSTPPLKFCHALLVGADHFLATLCGHYRQKCAVLPQTCA